MPELAWISRWQPNAGRNLLRHQHGPSVRCRIGRYIACGHVDQRSVAHGVHPVCRLVGGDIVANFCRANNTRRCHCLGRVHSRDQSHSSERRNSGLGCSYFHVVSGILAAVVFNPNERRYQPPRSLAKNVNGYRNSIQTKRLLGLHCSHKASNNSVVSVYGARRDVLRHKRRPRLATHILCFGRRGDGRWRRQRS